MATTAKPSGLGKDGAVLESSESTPFTEDQLVTDRHPMSQFDDWFRVAKASGTSFEGVHAMTLATSTPEGRPSARMVILQGYGQDGFRFCSHWDSRKGHELMANPFAALVMYWIPLRRSVRIEGRVEKLPADMSDEYFHANRHDAQVLAACSKQSTVLESRDDIVQAFHDLADKYPEGSQVPRPEFWGGFLLRPDTVEFVQSQANHMDDRIRFQRDGDRPWKVDCLSP